MKEIQLTQGKVALVDDEDFEWLNQWKWFAHNPSGDKWYAVRNLKSILGKRKTVKMHRLIMNTPENMECDHQDNDGLNCQRYNLRNCTHSHNIMNSRKRSDNTSGYKGVSFDKRRGKWIARIYVNGKEMGLEYFTNIEDAARAYDKKAKELHGEFANLNFPENK